MVDEPIQRLIEDMFETLKDAEGLGLAAPQVGVSVTLFIIDPAPLASRGVKLGATGEPLVFVNPRIVIREETECLEEGCLSLPGISEKVERPGRIVLRALDRKGNEIEVVGEEVLARAFSHEIDHLEGVLLVDRITPLRRELLKPRLKELARQAAESRRRR